MKVLFLTNIPSPYRVDFFDELGKLCDLTVLYERMYAKGRNENWKSSKGKYFREIFLKGIMIGNDTAICFSVLRYLQDKSYDLIVVGGYSTPTGMIAINYLDAKKIPFILNCDGGMIKNDNPIKHFIKNHFIKRASSWLSPSRISDEYLENYGAKGNKIYRYPFTSVKQENILNNLLTVSEKKIIREKLGIKEKKMIVAIGQFIYRKGFDILLNSSEYISKDIGVYIIGGEPPQEYISRKMELNLNNVYFVGFKNKNELIEYYKAADLFVLPTREDIWGLVINESMANGLPVITTNKCVAGMELIDNQANGFIIPVEDEVTLYEKINTILEDDKLLKKMSENSLEKISEYTIENMAKRHILIFRDFIEGNQRY